MEKNAISKELKRIAKENGGLLKPEKIVEEAKPKDSILHNSFTWDDSQAAREYRLWQARMLIRTQYSYTQEGMEYRTFVSLTTDRGEEGYREIISVFSNPTQREQLLQDAFNEMQRFEDKYRTLSELKNVFGAMKEVKRLIQNSKIASSHKQLTEVYH